MSDEKKQNASEVPSMATLLGGQELEVQYLDGRTETVKVRQLPIRQLQEYGKRTADEESMADFLCGRPDGWSATLKLESVEAIVELGDRLNADFFARWYRRNAARNERLAPGITEKLQANFVRLQSASSTSLPSPESIPGKPSNIPSRS